MRFTVGLELGDELLPQVLDTQSALRSQFSDIQWLKKEQLFVSIKFLGNPDKRFHKSLKKVLAEVAQGIAPFSITLDKAGCFPAEEPTRVVWVSVKESGGMLERFSHDCDKAFARFGIAPNEDEFIPHVVIGRVQVSNTKGKLIKAAQKAQVKPNIRQVSDACLILSRLDKKEGAKYEVISRAPFTATVAG